MAKKIIIILVLAFIVCAAIPGEWITIYKHYHFNGTKVPLKIPVEGISKSELEDTFGAPRGDNRKHLGIDILSSRGTKVLSSTDGVIIYKGRDILGGNVVKILGADNKLYYYAHLDSFENLEAEQQVKRGEIIGYVGNTGDAVSTPLHLHFEVMKIKWLFPLIMTNENSYYLL